MENKECKFCVPKGKYEYKDLIIEEYENWIVELTNDCGYLGQCIIRSRECIKDDIFYFDFDNEKENHKKILEDFFAITKCLKEAVTKIFRADMFNYAILRNSDKHLHMHFIPRYSEEIKLSLENVSSDIEKVIIFNDKKWGHNYYPYDALNLSDSVKKIIKEKIKKELEKNNSRPRRVT